MVNPVRLRGGQDETSTVLFPVQLLFLAVLMNNWVPGESGNEANYSMNDRSSTGNKGGLSGDYQSVTASKILPAAVQSKIYCSLNIVAHGQPHFQATARFYLAAEEKTQVRQSEIKSGSGLGTRLAHGNKTHSRRLTITSQGIVTLSTQILPVTSQIA